MYHPQDLISLYFASISEDNSQRIYKTKRFSFNLLYIKYVYNDILNSKA